MASKKSVFVILILNLLVMECIADEDFVNPSDPLNFDPVNICMDNKIENEKVSSHEQMVANTDNDDTMKKGSPIHNSNDEYVPEAKWKAKTKDHCPALEDETVKSIFKRYLMSLAQRIESRIDSSDVPITFCLKMKASHSDLMLLKLYGISNSGNIHEVQERLEKMILYTTELPNESTIFWLEKKIGLSISILLMVFAILLLGIIGGKMLSSVQVTRSLISKGLLFAFMVSSAFAYVELYQQKVADQDKILSDGISERCPHLSKNMWSRVFGYFSSTFTFQDENCREYYEATVVHPFFKVSLLEAGAIAVTKTIVAPLKILGKGLKEFMVGLLKDLPAQYSWFLFIIMMVTLVLYPVLKCGFTVRIPWLLTLQPPSATQRYLPSPETKPALCRNCTHDKEQGKTALSQPEIKSSLPVPEIVRYNSKPGATEFAIEDAGDCKRIEKECTVNHDKSQVKGIVIKLKSCEISSLLDRYDSTDGVENKLSELVLEDEKGCSSETVKEVTDSNDIASSTACVTHGDALPNSDFFLDEEIRSSDKLGDIESMLH